jgi:hypothetical protein
VIEKSGPEIPANNSSESELPSRLDEEREARFAAMGRISDAFADVPLDELEAEVDRAVAIVRAKQRAGRIAAD